MRFDVQHAGATQTVSTTNSSIEGVEQDVSDVTADCHTLTGSLGQSPVVSSAIEGLKQEVLAPTGEAVLQRARNATSSTSEALDVFMGGDQEMAQQGRSHESQVGPPDLPGVN